MSYRPCKLFLNLLPALLCWAMVVLPCFASNKSTGKATIYAGSFSGKKTASGAVYKPSKLTAASKTLPLGSKVAVTNKQTGKKVTVEINDRMAKKTSAVIDLSKGAANRLGVKGRAPVETAVVKKGH